MVEALCVLVPSAFCAPLPHRSPLHVCVNHQCFHCCLLSLQALSEEELAHVLCEPKNALVKQYSGIFAKNGVK